jgi:DNA helicase-2/ATP-dependent DNA helicase PcrA
MSSADFEPSAEQQRVIDYRGGHLQIIACAGSGKTEAISRRVAKLIVDGVPPASIIAFTFTERAAEAMKSRILHRVAGSLGPQALDKISPMYIGTIHSYCMRMLQDHVPEYANYDVLDENRLAGLLSREINRLKLKALCGAHWESIHEFLRNADVVENELIPVKELQGSEFGRCHEQYCAMLKRYHFLTFGQLISSAVRALSDPVIFQRVHAPLRYLVVDEYQDINPAQEQLIRLLAKPPVHLTVVGDDDQAIYQWRGSNVNNMQGFAKRYDSESRTLSTNRRGRPKIIATANTFAKSISPRLPKKMRPYRPASGPELCCWAAETAIDEARVIAETIEHLINRGYRYRDIAILARSVRTTSPPIIDALRHRNIPVRCAGRTGFFLLPEAQVLGKTYAWLSNNGWKSERYGKSKPVDLDELIAEFATVFNLKSPDRKKLRQLLIKWQERAQDEHTTANLVRDYYILLRLLGVQLWDLSHADISARAGSLATFSELLADFEHVRRRARWVQDDGEETYRGGQSAGEWYYRNLFNYIQFYALDSYDDFGGEDSFEVDAVDILTIHRAKGLEWPVVFVPALVEGRFPSKYAGEEQDWLLSAKAFPETKRRRYAGSEADERRLFYVAMTRARDVVYLSRFRKKKNTFRASPFLVEVAGGEPKALSKLPLPPDFVPAQQSSLDKPTLSFSELAAYEECPLSYRLSSRLGFQPQLVAELGYGKAVHHILRRLADHVREEGKLPTAVALKRLFDAEFYLPFAHKPAYEKLREAADRLIGRYLTEYSDDLHRIWLSERPFELHLDDGIVSGRADVILDREGGDAGSLALVDYKTATDPDGPDLYAFQLAVYAAAGHGEGINIRGAYLHDLAEGTRIPIGVMNGETEVAKQRANELVRRISLAQFEAKPEKRKCGQCDVRFVCTHGPAR